MALQVGELFASLTVDTSGVEQALDSIGQQAERLRTEWITPQMRGMAEDIWAAMAETLQGESGGAIMEAWMNGMVSGAQAEGLLLTETLRSAGENAAAAAAGALDPQAGYAIGAAFAQSIAAGIGSMRGVMAQAAETLRQAAPATAVQRASAAVGGESGQAGSGAASEANFARMVASALSGVTVRLDGAAVGSLVAPAVSRSIAERAAARRYGTE